jgi:N-(2-amino-2-carboxyethyl)-L-glutamate synthase
MVPGPSHHPEAMTAELWQPIAPTPVSELLVSYRGATSRVLVKQESASRSGSVKARTALGLLRSMDAISPLVPGTVVVESTSGNLGVALAQWLASLECQFVAVIDPKTPASAAASMRASGAVVVMTNRPDGRGGYLLSRLAAVRQLCADNPGYRWTNQYENRANPAIHEQTTGPEILAQGGLDLDAVYVAVSTGGTLAGISRHIRSRARLVSLVAVDAHLSLATPPGRERVPQPPAAAAGARLLPGIGSSRRSSFLSLRSYDRRVGVRDSDAISMCRILRADTGLGLGASTGYVVSACVSELPSALAPLRALCLSPDDASLYEDTVYDDGWVEGVGLSGQVARSIADLRADGLAFELTDPGASCGMPSGPRSCRGHSD